MRAAAIAASLVSSAAIAEEGATLVALEIVQQRELDAREAYLAYAERAEREGIGFAADLFRVVARAESVHAVRHRIAIEQLGGRPALDPRPPVVGTTAGNLRAAIEAEWRESRLVYVRFAEYARDECLYDALATLRDAREAEATHVRLFRAGLDAVRDGRSGPGWTLYVCSGDGAVSATPPTGRCPLCGTGASSFWAAACRAAPAPLPVARAGGR